MSKITSDNRYYVLPWNHDELLEMLQQIDTKCLLTPEEYHILVNEKGIDNLVTELDTDNIVIRLDALDTDKAKQEDFEVMLSKINQLIKINEGQEEGNLELIDIRNGANGRTYLTAGDAIRSQFKDLNALIEPIMVSNSNQDEEIYELKTSNVELLKNYNNKVQEAEEIFEDNRYELRQLNEKNVALNIRLANLEKVNANQQIYLNALLDDSDMAKVGKVEYIMEYKSESDLLNPNPKAGEGVLIVDAIKGITLTNLITAPSSFVIETGQVYSEEIRLKANTDYIVKFKCETEDTTKTSVIFEQMVFANITYTNTSFSVNNDVYNTFMFTVDKDGYYRIVLDCMEQVEIIDLLVMEHKPAYENIGYFKGAYSTFENFLNEETGKYELTMAIRDFYNEKLIVDQIDINLTSPLLEYDEIVHYGDIGFCHVHRTIINEETNLPETIEDEKDAIVEQLEVVKNDTVNVDSNYIFISDECNFAIYKRGTYSIKEDTPEFSIVPPEKVIVFYDTTMQNAALLARNIDIVEDQNYEVMALNWDMNYRMAEIQWALEEAGLNKIEGDGIVEPMQFTVVEIAKKLIQAHKYVENIFIKQLDRYLLKGTISKKEHKELMDMIKEQ